MTAILYPRKLVQLNDVVSAGIQPGDVPTYDGASFTFGPGGGAGSFSLGVSNLGNTLGDTGVTGTRLVLAGIGNLTLSQATDPAGGTISISAGTAAGGAFSLGVSGGNTAGQTGATGSRVVLAGGSNVTLSQATDANGGTITVNAAGFTQTVQTQNLFDLTLDGNTAGALQLVSSGTLTLAGGNNITLSQNGNAITISGANTVAAQTGISSIAASNATFTSGQVEFTGSGIVTVRTSVGQRVVIDASVAAQSVQTQNLHNVTLSGNTAGVMAQISSGTMTLAGGNNITLSQNGNAVTISAAAAGGAQTAISGIAASNTTYTSGTVTFTGVGGGVTVSSNTGQRIDISVAAPVAQTNQAGSIYAIGNTTSSSSGTYDARTLSISGAGMISVAATNSGWKISATQSAESQSFGMSNIGNTSGTTGIASGAQMRFLLAGGNNVTLSQSLNGASGTITISAFNQTVQTQNMVAVTLSGNTSGAQALISSGTMTLAGGNNITVSQNGNAITISGPNVGGAQTGISGIANSQTTYTSGTVSLSELGAITIRSTTGNQFQLSVNAQSVQPETQTFVGGLANSQTTYTSGTISLSELGAITIRSTTGNQFQLSVNAQSVQTQSLFSAGVSNLGNTAGDTGITGTRMVFVGTNNITLSQATAAAGGTITISGPTTAVQTADSGGAYAVGNTYSSSSGTFDVRTLSIRGDGIISVAATNSGWRISASQSVQAETQTFVGGLAASNTTYTSGTISITGVGGGVTVSSNTGQRIDISVAAPVAQSGTQFSLGLSNIGNTAGDTVTVGGRVILAGGNGVTLSGSSNGASQTITISGVTQSVQTQNMVAVTLSGNTAGAMALVSSGTLTLAGGNGITLSQAGNAVTISGGAAGGAFSAGVSTGGNTAGATGITGTQLVLVGSNNITLSQTTGANGGTVSIVGVPSFSAGVSTGGNTAGATGLTGTQMVWVGSSPISLSQTTGANGGTITINAPAVSSIVGVSGVSVSTNGSTISIMQTTGSAFLTSLAPYDESPMVTGQQGQGSLHLTPVRVPEGVQFDRAGLALQISNATNSSGSFTLSQWMGFYSKNVSTLSLLMSTSISTNFTGSGTVGSYSLYAGPAWQTIGWTTTLPEGDYYAGIISRTTSGGADHSLSQLLLSKYTNSGWSGIIGAASATSVQRLLGQGHYSATTSAFPASIHFSQIVGSGSIALRSPIWMLRSGTV